MRGDNSSFEGNSEELEKPLRGMKEVAASLRGRILGSPRGPRTTEWGEWLSGGLAAGPTCEESSQEGIGSGMGEIQNS